ncbi:MAG: threonine synthase [Candidatus Wallbacteria bacterium HGW-Wallbacteria-1]|jgi:threonine synthase|uniref:Threonine synthase n=1 Tax=Candidatus Wallbacteria bacterium HGW-Wallbacteria-1 TaxID=2013854 RepID=A0A2N1PRY2_9BACT|nr:MAG: threonine synthase [Candidatus Wallbacteria bacterium HGW-Wallbacteria-1]
MSNVTHLQCINCLKTLDPAIIDYTCPHCGSNLDVHYNMKDVAAQLTKKGLSENRDYSVFRYLPLLPIENDLHRPPVTVGWTPLIKAELLEKSLGIRELYLKDDGRNPSASFKDRASVIGMIKALEKGRKIITGASTGNAASSLSCLTATKDLKTIIFVPKTAPQAKIAQLLVFGATVFTVRGTYDDAFDLCTSASEKWGWYNRNTGMNPYLSEGKKTCAMEISEQLGWKVPDALFVSVGDGCIIGGIHKGFRDLLELGFIDRIPRLFGVQAHGSDAVTRAIESDGIIRSIEADTIADSISVNLPRDGMKAVRAIKDTDGHALRVTDEEILQAIPKVARGASVFGEPAGVTAFAGLIKALEQKLISPDSSVVCVITGNGLKDIASAMKSVGIPTEIPKGPEGLKTLESMIV